MKKGVKRTLTTVGVLAVLLFSIFGLLLYRVLSDMRNMKLVRTGEIVAHIYAVRDSYVDLYLVRCANRFITFDSGISHKNVQKELQNLGIDPMNVIAVFLTHSDMDHDGGLPLFRNAKIYLAVEEEQMVNGRTSRFATFRNSAIPKHALLKDGQAVEIEGRNVVAILTPGHTPGSMCYLVDGKYLFTGDSMRLQDANADIFSKTINMNSDAQRESLKKLAKLKGVEYVFTGILVIQIHLTALSRLFVNRALNMKPMVS